MNDTYASFIKDKWRNNVDDRITQKQRCDKLMKEETGTPWKKNKQHLDKRPVW